LFPSGGALSPAPPCHRRRRLALDAGRRRRACAAATVATDTRHVAAAGRGALASRARFQGAYLLKYNSNLYIYVDGCAAAPAAPDTRHAKAAGRGALAQRSRL